MNSLRRTTIALLVLTLVTAAACSKTVMQTPESDEPEPQPAAHVEATSPQPEPAPVPQAVDNRDRQRDLFLHEHVYFDYDSAVLNSSAKASLEFKIRWLRDHSDVIGVRIDGHCDERGTPAYNLALGERRAQAVKTYLVEKGVAMARLDTRSFGESQPLDTRHIEEAWAKNRRVSFLID